MIIYFLKDYSNRNSDNNNDSVNNNDAINGALESLNYLVELLKQKNE